MNKEAFQNAICQGISRSQNVPSREKTIQARNNARALVREYIKDQIREQQSNKEER